MKRALRRHHHHRIRVRRLRYLWNIHGSRARSRLMEKPWECHLSQWLMTTPGWWVNEFMTRPARAETQALLHKIEREERDPEGVIWPDYHRPHIYYW